MYQNNIKELENLNQMLKDEHQALHLAFASLEEKLRKAQVIAAILLKKSHAKIEQFKVNFCSLQWTIFLGNQVCQFSRLIISHCDSSKVSYLTVKFTAGVYSVMYDCLGNTFIFLHIFVSCITHILACLSTEQFFYIVLEYDYKI